MLADSIRVAACQMTSVDNVEKNLSTIITLISKIDLSKVGMVCFPETSLYMRVIEGEKVVALDSESEVFGELKKIALESSTWLHLGSVPFVVAAKTYNTSISITPTGELHIGYSKIHLFDVDVIGHMAVRESDTYCAGEGGKAFEYLGWKFGESICYDLRFAELYSSYARQGVDALLIPSAFIVPTGKAHWEVLVRARAIESQCYVIACGQGGEHRSIKGGVRKTYGHSMIVDPWGEVLAVASESQPIIEVDLEKKRIEQIRNQIPMQKHRRLK